MGWDQHENLPTQIKGQASDVDQPTAALIMDLKQRGLLEDTLVVWGGEFGRTSYGQLQTSLSAKDSKAIKMEDMVEIIIRDVLQYLWQVRG